MNQFEKAVRTFHEEQRKADALFYIREKDFTKQQLEQMISLTMVEGGLPLREIFALWDEWEKILRVAEPEPKPEKCHYCLKVKEKGHKCSTFIAEFREKAPYMDLDD